MDKRRQDLASKYEASRKAALELPVEKATDLAKADEQLKDLRQICQTLILHDITFANSQNVATQLWAAHGRINAVYRKHLSGLRKTAQVNPVETHKFGKQYLAFLKDSQRFYRQLIQALNATYGAIPELQQISQIAPAEAKGPNDPSKEVCRETLLSCHQCLIYLGDLSRYRASQKLDKDPEWGPAVGYYNLAAALRPESGMAYHQLSVIALEEGDHLRAIYYLYRAIVVKDPHPLALANLEIEFRKIRRAWNAGSDLPREPVSNQAKNLRKLTVAWFVRMHCLYFEGQASSSSEEVAKEFQSRLLQLLRDCIGDGIVQKMFLINLAAQHTAAGRFEREPNNPNHMQSYLYVLETNIQTMTTLLRLVVDEVLQISAMQSTQLSERIAPNLQALLPFLRIYSAWLLTNAKILLSNVGGERINDQIATFWKLYAQAASLLATNFPVAQLPEVKYQLPEDVECLGFKPLESQNTLRLWYEGDEKLPEFTKMSEQRLSDPLEDLARIRGVQIDALLLALSPDDPLIFDGVNFLVRTTRANSSMHGHRGSTQPPPGLEGNVASRDAIGSKNTEQVTPGEHESVRRMSEMVDQLVGKEQDQTSITSNHADTLARRISTLDTTPSQVRPGSADSARRMQSVSDLWAYESPSQPSTPQGEAPNRLVSQISRGHSRINSASSSHSMNSGQNVALASSINPTPLSQHEQHVGRLSTDHGMNRISTSALSGYNSGMNSPLLFGAGGVWSAKPRRSIQNETPPNGQGG